MSHAIENAKAWMESIVSMVNALEADYQRLEDLEGTNAEDLTEEEKAELAALIAETTVDGERTDAETAVERIGESILGIEYRSGWFNAGDEPDTPEEYRITLTTGGPALYIIGDLDNNGEPDSARLMFQDWGTGLTEYIPSSAERDALLTFACQFPYYR